MSPRTVFRTSSAGARVERAHQHDRDERQRDRPERGVADEEEHDEASQGGREDDPLPGRVLPAGASPVSEVRRPAVAIDMRRAWKCTISRSER